MFHFLTTPSLGSKSSGNKDSKPDITNKKQIKTIFKNYFLNLFLNSFLKFISKIDTKNAFIFVIIEFALNNVKFRGLERGTNFRI